MFVYINYINVYVCVYVYMRACERACMYMCMCCIRRCSYVTKQKVLHYERNINKG